MHKKEALPSPDLSVPGNETSQITKFPRGKTRFTASKKPQMGLF